MENYKKIIKENNTDIPDPKPDVLRIKDLHSWYKHLRGGVIAYPLLARGEEPRYGFDKRLTDPNQDNFHWRIVMGYNLDSYCIKLNDSSEDYFRVPDEIKDYMKKFPISLDGNFSSTERGFEQVDLCVKQCINFWNGLDNISHIEKDFDIDVIKVKINL